MTTINGLSRDDITRLIRKGRAAESRGKALGGCITAILTAVLMTSIRGWALMLGVGVIHNHWLPQVPGIGYWWAVVVVMTVRTALLGTAQATKSSGGSK